MSIENEQQHKMRTVRELGGEIWAELDYEWRNNQSTCPPSNWNTDAAILIVDIVMAVLARHTDTLIVMDEDLPVTPLPFRFPDENSEIVDNETIS